jgi:hypothetical protein
MGLMNNKCCKLNTWGNYFDYGGGRYITNYDLDCEVC